MSIWRLPKLGLALAAWLVLVGGTYLIAQSSAEYLEVGREHPFVLEHGETGRSGLWLAMLAIHIGAGVACLAASFLQFFRPVLRRWPWLHRWMGRVYMVGVLAFLTPTGFYLAPFAAGGVAGKAGFMLLGVLTGLTSAMAWLRIRQRKITSHIGWSIRSMAMVTSAITFRILFVFLRDAAPTPEIGFLIALYLSILGNAAVAELIVAVIRRATSRPRRSPSPSPSQSPSLQPQT